MGRGYLSNHRIRISRLVSVRRRRNTLLKVWLSIMAPKTGRRGTKRKADAVQEEEEKFAVELKESKEEVKDNDSGGRRVIIEHCKS
ncbi:unnamed protein product [Gadus morhua 'NCC']